MSINKRAEVGSKIIFYMVFAFIATVTAGLLVYIITSEIAGISKIPPGLEEYLLVKRFTYSKDCFVDESTGIISWDKFTDITLRDCYNTDSNSVKAFRLSLSIIDSNGKITEEIDSITTENYDGFFTKKIEKDIEILKDSKTYAGKLTIYVENENK